MVSIARWMLHGQNRRPSAKSVCERVGECPQSGIGLLSRWAFLAAAGPQDRRTDTQPPTLGGLGLWTGPGISIGVGHVPCAAVGAAHRMSIHSDKIRGAEVSPWNRAKQRDSPASTRPKTQIRTALPLVGTAWTRAGGLLARTVVAKPRSSGGWVAVERQTAAASGCQARARNSSWGSVAHVRREGRSADPVPGTSCLPTSPRDRAGRKGRKGAGASGAGAHPRPGGGGCWRPRP